TAGPRRAPWPKPCSSCPPRPPADSRGLARTREHGGRLLRSAAACSTQRKKALSAPSLSSRLSAFLSVRSASSRQHDADLRALAVRAVDLDAPAVGLRDLPRDVQTHAEPAEVAVAMAEHAFELMEDAAQVVRRDADALIGHAEHGHLRIGVHADEDGLA